MVWLRPVGDIMAFDAAAVPHYVRTMTEEGSRATAHRGSLRRNDRGLHARHAGIDPASTPIPYGVKPMDPGSRREDRME